MFRFGYLKEACLSGLNLILRNLPIIAGLARKKGLKMSDSNIYNKVKNYNAERLGFSSLNLSEQEKAVDILKSIIIE